MQLLWRDEASSDAAVSKVTGLPPGVVFRADNLEDVASLEGHCCILTWDGRILRGIIVKQGPHEQLKNDKVIYFSFP